ncbi:hypothetical protein ACVWWI_006496 [Bradyrhizobium sp. USDA 3686]|nr:hypothetical protein [Bradyrhizobium canariense]
MKDVLNLYAEAPDPKRPAVCFDESPVQLIGEARQPIPARLAQLERYDYEHRRNGTVVFLAVHRPWRKVTVTERERRKTTGFGRRERLIHSAGALCPMRARPRRHPLSRILRRLEFHYTPKHASWLNMVEIEIGVLRGQCLDRRIVDSKRLRRESAAWERKRNAARSRITWMFTTDKARARKGRAYPAPSKES